MKTITSKSQEDSSSPRRRNIASFAALVICLAQHQTHSHAGQHRLESNVDAAVAVDEKYAKVVNEEK